MNEKPPGSVNRRQICGVCGISLSSKADMDSHTETVHGQNWAPGQLTRSKDQMEFKPSLSQTPWGEDFKERVLNRR